MKKVGIITSVICAVAVIAGTWYFMQRIQKSEQENEILQQIVQELDEKLKQEQAKPHLENEELWQKVQELEKKLTLAQEKLKHGLTAQVDMMNIKCVYYLGKTVISLQKIVHVLTSRITLNHANTSLLF